MHRAQSLRLIVATAKPANDGHDVCSVLSTWPGVTRGAVQATGRPRFLPLSTLLSATCDPPRKKAPKLRAWRASLLRSRAHLLGIVYALDEKAAEAAAIAEFKIHDD
jgi:hypothetical protein